MSVAEKKVSEESKTLADDAIFRNLRVNLSPKTVLNYCVETAVLTGAVYAAYVGGSKAKEYFTKEE